jgi:tetratricopeptide (TPR) repeat protein
MTEDSGLLDDELSAHLERGWELFERGELDAARRCGEEVLKLDDENPDGHTLLGAVAVAGGEVEEGRERFLRAMDADPEHLEATLYAAELAIDPDEDYEEALRLLDQAEDVAEDGPAELDIRLLRAEALVASGDRAALEGLLSSFPETDQLPATVALRLGRVMIEGGDSEKAIPLLERCLTDPATEVDGRYFMAIAFDLTGRRDEARHFFIQVHAADRKEDGADEVGQDGEAADRLQAALEGFPRLRGLLGEAKVALARTPPLELVTEGVDPRAPAYLACSVTGHGEISESAREPRQAKLRSDAVEDDFRVLAIFAYERNLRRYARGAEAQAREFVRAVVGELTQLLDLDDQEVSNLLEPGR